MTGLTLPKSKRSISQKELFSLYISKKQSVAQIARRLKCSQNKVNYWLSKYGISKRSISDAIYQLKNPLGDPFFAQQPKTMDEARLFGMGLGLY
jgi:transposase-like protein